MKRLLQAFSLSVLVAICPGTIAATPAPDPAGAAQTKGTMSPASVLDLTVETLDGGSLDLSTLRGKTVLIVNTASACGYTPQLGKLEKLYATHKAKGLVVVGFPSNDFGGQEPGTPAEIGAFCKKNYGVTFPLMAKVHAKGADAAPVYRFLTEKTAPAIRGEVKWNFTKFLVSPQGEVVARFEPNVDPLAAEVVAAIEKHLPR